MLKKMDKLDHLINVNGISNPLPAVISIYILRNYTQFDHRLSQPSDMFKFIFIACIASTSISAFIGTSTLVFDGTIPSEIYITIFSSWWIGDAAGVLLFAPILLTYKQWYDFKWDGNQVIELVFLTVLAILLGSLVFTDIFRFTDSDQLNTSSISLYLTFPICIWAAMRFWQSGTAAFVTIFSAFAVYGSINGIGPFGLNNPYTILLQMNMFLSTLMMVSLTLAATAASLNISQLKLAKEAVELAHTNVKLDYSHSKMEEKVKERTRELDINRSEMERTLEYNNAIFKVSLDALITIDSEGKVIGFNKVAEDTFGWRKEEIVGKLLEEHIIPENMREAHKRGMRHYLKTGSGPVLGKLVELVGLHRDGHTFPIEIAISATTSDKKPMFVAFIKDISARREDEKKLIKANQELAIQYKEKGKRTRELTAILALSPDGFVLVNAENNIAYINPALLTMTRFKKEKIVGKSIQAFGELMESLFDSSLMDDSVVVN